MAFSLPMKRDTFCSNSSAHSNAYTSTHQILRSLWLYDQSPLYNFLWSEILPFFVWCWRVPSQCRPQSVFSPPDTASEWKSASSSLVQLEETWQSIFWEVGDYHLISPASWTSQQMWRCDRRTNRNVSSLSWPATKRVNGWSLHNGGRSKKTQQQM